MMHGIVGRERGSRSGKIEQRCELRSQAYALSAAMSHVSDEFAASDRVFWPRK